MKVGHRQALIKKAPLKRGGFFVGAPLVNEAKLYEAPETDTLKPLCGTADIYTPQRIRQIHGAEAHFNFCEYLDNSCRAMFGIILEGLILIP